MLSFRPLTGISLFLYRVEKLNEELKRVFVPSRGFLFFYYRVGLYNSLGLLFSSPHGDFSFSINMKGGTAMKKVVFVPSRGFLFFYVLHRSSFSSPSTIVFVPSRGFLFFYQLWGKQVKTLEAVFVPSRGFLFFYTIVLNSSLTGWKEVFVPSRGFLGPMSRFSTS